MCLHRWRQVSSDGLHHMIKRVHQTHDVLLLKLLRNISDHEGFKALFLRYLHELAGVATKAQSQVGSAGVLPGDSNKNGHVTGCPACRTSSWRRWGPWPTSTPRMLNSERCPHALFALSFPPLPSFRPSRAPARWRDLALFQTQSLARRHTDTHRHTVNAKPHAPVHRWRSSTVWSTS